MKDGRHVKADTGKEAPTLSLPDPAARSAAGLSGEVKMEAASTVLVVDDDPVSLSYVVRVLNDCGLDTLTAHDGTDALCVLESEHVDLIITDVMMPQMNGYQLHSRLLEKPEWVMIPVVFLTVRSMNSDVRYAKEMGVDAYLTKPVDPDDLKATVRGRLLRARMQQEARLRRNTAPVRRNGDWSVGRLRINSQQYRVWLGDEPVKLSLTEFKLLACLARRSPQAVPLEELVKSTHGLETDYQEASALIRPMVRSVRRKLGYPAGDMGCITSVRGVGYQLVAPSHR
jgi:DNA-binding response OmpR family regulator